MKPVSIFLVLIALACPLWSQKGTREYVLVARRGNIAEIVDADSLRTFNRIQFDFLVERMSGGRDGRILNIDGYEGRTCCKHYRLDLGTAEMTAFVPADGPRYYGGPLISPDGRWSIRLKSFRGPALQMTDLREGGPARELIPPGLAPEDDSGNWNAQGVWSGDRFYLYVSRPDDPGFLWTLSPGVFFPIRSAESLEAGIPVAPFNEAPGCPRILPVVKRLVAAGGNLLLFEPFGNREMGSRACDNLPGGAWILDPETGRLDRQIASELHFSTLISDPSQSELYGTVLAGAGNRGEPEQLVRLNAQDGRVMRSRNMGPGESLAITVGPLVEIPLGDMNVSLSAR